MQTVSDPFLGWGRDKESGRDFYWRQLRDWKGSVDVEGLDASDLRFYAGVCGWTLARAHARSGDPIAISGYLGSNDAFDEALVQFSERYADQNEIDHQRFVDQIDSGNLEAERE
jgi:sugar/nucleoside kinase (ribokinase family)